MTKEQGPSEALALLEELMQPTPKVAVIEGGPCSGKSTLLTALGTKASALGQPLVVIPEAASEYIAGLQAEGRDMKDLMENDRPAYLQLESDILGTTVARIEAARLKHVGTDSVVVVDRADIGSYVTDNEYQQILAGLKLDRPPIYSLADKVIFLPSVANENPELYAKLVSTNPARYEASAAEAARVSDANLAAVASHPELEVAWGGDFDAKIGRLVLALLQPELEGEVKLAVPALAAEQYIREARQRGDKLNVMTITQSYHELAGQEFRLRLTDSAYRHYHLTIKTGSGAVRQELQRSLTLEQYKLLKHARQIGQTLVKQRHVVLDPPEADGHRRLWFADNYAAPELPYWHFETEVADEAEASAVASSHPDRERVTSSARALALTG